MANDATKVKLGVCSVELNGVDMGLTIGGVEVVYTPTFKDSQADQYTGLIEKFLIGEKLEAKVPLAQFTLANIKAVIAHGTIDGGHLDIGSQTGKRASASAARLVLHPIANLANDKSEDVVIYKAVSGEAVTIAMKNDGEKILMATFTGLVDESKADGSMIGLIGDSAS